MKQIAQNYKTGELKVIEVPAPRCRPGGVLVQTAFSAVSTGTELMKFSEGRLSLIGKARARPDQVAKVVRSVQQQGLLATYNKVMNKLDSFTPLGYSSSGIVVEIGEGVSGFHVGQRVCCAGNQYATHAEYNWVPTNLCVPLPDGAPLDQAAFTTIAAIALQAMRQSETRLGETVCVIGLGLIGQILVRLLRSAGVRTVGLDRLETRCRSAEAAGAVLCAVASDDSSEQFASRVTQLTAGNGVDCVFITAGSNDPDLAKRAAGLLRDRGRIVDIGKCTLNLPWNDFYDKELDVRFSRSYGPGRYDPLYEEGGIDYPIGQVRWTERRNMEAIVGLLADGRLDFSSLVTDVVAFDAAVSAFERLNKGSADSLGVLFSYAPDAARSDRIAYRPRAVASKDRVRLGVIGAGAYASSMLLPQLVSNDQVELVEVVTNTGLSGATAARKFGFARASTNASTVLEADDIDAVLIATRHASHADLAARALRAGKAVFVEKPLALDRTSLARVIETVHQTGNDRLMVGFNRRFSPLLSSARDSFSSSGPQILHYRVVAGPLEKTSWYSQAETEGSRFAGEGGHFIDALSWWVGSEPVRVTASAAGSDIDNLVATLTFDDGSVATLSYLTGGDSRVPKELLEASGSAGFVKFDNFSRVESWSKGSRSSKKAPLDKGQGPMLSAFVDCVRSGKPMPIPFQSLLATTRATLAVQESAATGLLVDLRSATPPEIENELSASAIP
ncbi:putative bi-domain oxidoreductase (N-ter: Zinc-binding dehydrogenase/C-ter:NAD-binding oxydoreductase) [Bradyrhizobium sp. ORS 278]|uniref:bi-domain-containing oxidoreductase n=1 Tax=Bradyrhizobium sp. (strain ORS 278) TaxID=114615 RepID=UPI000150850F|nr:bi-domain-containing oxidoreductase [Bradyrhizobium sp. ORS 278]CAL80628.1 putative bi-domain oxidoreductase (N-ter: Zinc-binding dehydrogenase/C-ter:NAD-binding oxydoreductase) [Bradyrhizobium sp. ORS 278]